MLICLFALVGNRHGEVQITRFISSVGGGFILVQFSVFAKLLWVSPAYVEFRDEPGT